MDSRQFHPGEECRYVPTLCAFAPLFRRTARGAARGCADSLRSVEALASPDTTVEALDRLRSGRTLLWHHWYWCAGARWLRLRQFPLQQRLEGRGSWRWSGPGGFSWLSRCLLTAGCRSVLTPSSDSRIEASMFPHCRRTGMEKLRRWWVMADGRARSVIRLWRRHCAKRYASASNDGTGHRANDGGGGRHVRARSPREDYRFSRIARCTKTVVKAKLITVAFYGRGPKYSYYNGCSTGGRQGPIEATRFLDDFDAVAAKARWRIRMFICTRRGVRAIA